MTNVRNIQDSTNLALRSNRAIGFALPLIIPLKKTVVVMETATGTFDFVEVPTQNFAQNKTNNQYSGALQKGLVEQTNFIVPLSFALDNAEPYRLPIDPIISLNGKNIITRRAVSKSKYAGRIKERWSQDDWIITIQGVLIGADREELALMVENIRTICEQSVTGVDIICNYINNTYGIYRMAIEDYDFPFTRGEENQVFVIRGYSDSVYDLLIEQDNV